jgi:hypothetical protein
LPTNVVEERAVLIEIFRHVPIWVFALLAYLIYVGVQALRPNVRRLQRMFVAPAVFIVWGLIGLFQRMGTVPAAGIYWLAGALIGVALGVAIRQSMRVDRAAQRVYLPGSPVPLLRNVGLFAAHFILNVTMAMFVVYRAQLAGCDVLVSGFGLGFFAGWLWRFLQTCREAPSIDLTAQPMSVVDSN